MNKILFTGLVALLSIAFLSSCEKKDPVPVGPGYLSSDRKAAQLIQADNAFAFDLLTETDRVNTEDNFMISPLSVSMALGMAYNGAEGETKQAFETTLEMDGLDRYDLNRIHGDLRNYLIKADPKVTLAIANSIWVRNPYTILKSFADTNALYYHAEVANIDFSANDAARIINNWVSGNTNGKITSIIDDIPVDAVMYLINAIYFNGSWKTAFDRDKTGEMTFHYSDGTTGQVTAMQMKAGMDYLRKDLFSAVELPYGNGSFVMDVFLPAEGKSVTDVIGWLADNPDSSWVNDFNKAGELLIKLPKFRFGYKTLLNEPLKDMGLTVAFTPAADFSGMLEETQDLEISRVIHKTWIDVNEKGTEAAAVTAVEISSTSVAEPLAFIADHPFLFVIREKKTGAVLFTGKVGRPVYEEGRE